jgi:hypothetical protein
MDVKQLRKLCALVAEVAASDAALLNDADVILAKAPDQRQETNINAPPATQEGGKKYKLTRKRSSKYKHSSKRQTKKN